MYYSRYNRLAYEAIGRGMAIVDDGIGDHQGELVKRFLEEGKRLEGALHWRPKRTRTDYVWTSHSIVILSGCLDAGILHLTAHVSRLPRKSGFNLMWRKAVILRLDVSPGTPHFNASSKTSVVGTHWQPWPDHEAEADSRDLDHREWLRVFCDRANIAFHGRQYRPPPFAREQLELPL